MKKKKRTVCKETVYLVIKTIKWGGENFKWIKKSWACIFPLFFFFFFEVTTVDADGFSSFLPAAKWSGDDFLPDVSLALTLCALTSFLTLAKSPFRQASNNSRPGSTVTVEDEAKLLGSWGRRFDAILASLTSHSFCPPATSHFAWPLSSPSYSTAFLTLSTRDTFTGSLFFLLSLYLYSISSPTLSLHWPSLILLTN